MSPSGYDGLSFNAIHKEKKYLAKSDSNAGNGTPQQSRERSDALYTLKKLLTDDAGRGGIGPYENYANGNVRMY